MTGEFGGEREMCREERGKCAERREGNVRGRERETFPKYPELLENPITNY